MIFVMTAYFLVNFDLPFIIVFVSFVIIVVVVFTYFTFWQFPF